MDTEKINKLFKSDLKVLNVGVELFHDEIKEAGGQSINLDWMPLCSGNKKLAQIIRKIRNSK